VAALRRVQANLKRYRAAVLKAACEGKLVPTEAELRRTADNADSTDEKSRKSAAKTPAYETGKALLTRILTERRRIHELAQADAARKRKYKEPMPPCIPADEHLPEGWTWATWDQIGFSQNGRPFPSAEYQEAGFKLLRPGNLHVSGKVVWTEGNTRCMPQRFADENPDLIVRGSELVMNLTAQSLKDEFLGRVCITGEDEGCLLNQRLARLTPVIVLPEFVLYLLKAWRFRRYVDGLNSGSLIQHMFTSQLAEFTFPFPPLAEQTRIVAEVERRLSVVEELEAVVSANLQRATRLRQSILQKAFTGQLLTADNADNTDKK
jgi:type I restriction enzyme S subunit